MTGLTVATLVCIASLPQGSSADTFDWPVGWSERKVADRAVSDAIPAHLDLRIPVGVGLMPAFVMDDGRGGFRGFDIDLWDAIADEIGMDFAYKQHKFTALLAEAKKGCVAAGLAGITINADREQEMDFSHPYISAGQQIAVPSKKGRQHDFLGIDLSGVVVYLRMLKKVLYLLVFVAVAATVLWFGEKGSNEAISDRFFPGIFQSCWCTLATMTTVGYGDIAPKQWFGRVVASVLMLSGITYFATITADMSSQLTVERQDYDISKPSDLSGRTVATVEGTASVRTLSRLGAQVVTAKNLDAACDKMLNGDAEAVVFDLPALQYHARTDGTGRIALVGNPFEVQTFGIVFPEGSPLREKVNRALHKLMENGVYEKIHRKWFGK